MNYIRLLSVLISNITGINYKYIYPSTLTIFSFLLLRLFLNLIKFILRIINYNNSYIFYKNLSIVLNTIYIIILIVIWDSYLNNIITLISFTSATLTLALKDFIFNYFSGIYINIRKPFVIDDRIEIGQLKGDVIATNILDFEIMEIGDYINSEQSTGKIVTIPNSDVFFKPVKNYSKNFNYIWEEITVKTNINSNINEVKGLLYEIINSCDLIKSIPSKMKKSINHLNFDEKIYYNKLEPIIYTRVVDNHIEFYIRYLMNPKKNRYIEDYIWNKILSLYENNKIKLYVE